MRTGPIVLAGLLLAVVAGCAARPAGVALGGDFRRVASDDGARARLLLRGADLGEVGFVSVSPSGRYAIFERDGGIFLVTGPTGRLHPVCESATSAPAVAGWDEGEASARVELRDGSTCRVESEPHGGRP